MKKNGSFLVLFNNRKKKKVFLVRRDDFYTWVVPGGGIEKGEKPKEAAIREAIEETGFKVKLVRSLGIYQISNKKGEKIDWNLDLERNINVLLIVNIWILLRSPKKAKQASWYMEN